MRVGIIGHCGTVGRAYAQIYRDRGACVVGIDPCDPQSHSYSDLLGVGLVYVCVPSPTSAAGNCVTATLVQTVHRLIAMDLGVPIVCKTTATPDTYNELHSISKFVIHSPEFLRQDHAVRDIERAELVVYGGHTNVAQSVRLIESQFVYNPHQASVEITDIKTAAIYKYLRNSYLAAKVTFMNDFYDLAETIGVDWKNIQHILERDGQLGPTHNAVPGTNGFGWAGACFPKDLTALLTYANINAVDLPVLETVFKRNQQHRLKNKDTK